MQDTFIYIGTGAFVGFVIGVYFTLRLTRKETSEPDYDGRDGNGYQPIVAPKSKPKRVPGEWTRHSELHFSTLLDGDILEWWPSANKFRWRGETRMGDPELFMETYNRDRVANLDTRNLRS